jgi:hypothetical protein
VIDALVKETDGSVKWPPGKAAQTYEVGNRRDCALDHQRHGGCLAAAGNSNRGATLKFDLRMKSETRVISNSKPTRPNNAVPDRKRA